LRGYEFGKIDFREMVEPVDGVQHGNGRGIGEDCFLVCQQGIARAVETGGAVVDIGMVVVHRTAG